GSLPTCRRAPRPPRPPEMPATETAATPGRPRLPVRGTTERENGMTAQGSDSCVLRLLRSPLFLAIAARLILRELCVKLHCSALSDPKDCRRLLRKLQRHVVRKPK